MMVLLWVVGLPGQASEQPYFGPSLKFTYDGPVIVHNSQIRYTGNDRLTFATESWLLEHAPDLLDLRPAVDVWASRLGIHPRVLAAIVRDDFKTNAPDDRLAGMERTVEIASALAQAMAQAIENRPADQLAASRAVTATANALGIDLALPGELAYARTTKTAKGLPSPLFSYFQPPWQTGETWAGGGAHGGTGSGTQNALDFWADYRGWGEDLSQWWVAAMQDGTARVWSSCGMAIVHGNGWVTDYYHLDNIQVADNGSVQRNSRIANYADNVDQALCSGGSSSGPHVHMSLSFNGSRVPINEDMVDFSAFSHHVGEGQYDSNCDRSYYTHYSQGKVCPNYDRLLNDAPLTLPAEIFSNGFEMGL